MGEAAELLGWHALGRAGLGESGLSGPGCFEASLPKGEGHLLGLGELFTVLPRGCSPGPPRGFPGSQASSPSSAQSLRCPGTEPRGVSYKGGSAEGGDGGAPPASAPEHRAQRVGKGGPGCGGGRGAGPCGHSAAVGAGTALVGAGGGGAPRAQDEPERAEPHATTSAQFLHTHWDARHGLAFIY